MAKKSTQFIGAYASITAMNSVPKLGYFLQRKNALFLQNYKYICTIEYNKNTNNKRARNMQKITIKLCGYVYILLPLMNKC